MQDYIVRAGIGPNAPQESRPGAGWAESWVDEYQEKGYTDIYVRDPDGKSISVDELRRRARAERAAAAAARAAATPSDPGNGA